MAAVPLLVSGKFRVQRRLGTGGMGVAYLAVDLSLQRPVALKTLPRLSAAAAQRLSDEARHMAAVVHPHLATIYGIEWWRGSPILVVEYLEGGTLAQRIANGPLPVADALRTGRCLTLALEHLHQAGLLHRDVKPSNIAYARVDDAPKLLDFGLATLIAKEPPEEEHVSLGSSTTGRFRACNRTVVGTPLYLPPEALNGADAGPNWDVWALAMTLYEAITGQHPFAAPTLAGVMKNVREARVPDLRSIRPDCPADVAQVLATALLRDPGARLANPSAFREGLCSAARHD